MMPKWIAKKSEDKGLLEAKYEGEKKVLLILMIVSLITVVYSEILIFLIPMFIIHNKWYKQIKELRENDEQEKLLTIARKPKNWKKEKYYYAICALIDLDNKEIGTIVKEEIIRSNPMNPIKYSARRLSILGGLLAYIEDKGDKKEEEEKEGEVSVKELVKKSKLPIELAYFITEEPQEEKCMVTKITLDFKQDEIVICPECRHYAKREQLEKWLEKKRECPVCKSSIRIEEFPIIVMRKRK